jgi:hypothetical protein
MAENRRMTDREVTGVAATEDGKRKDREPARETDGDIIPGVRASDIEPYTGLRYLSKLFRVMAVIIVLLLVAEVVTGLSTIGSAAIPTLLGEASRLLVLAGLLWGSGDLALLLIDIGHDVRAGRVFMTRQTYHITALSQKLGATTSAIPPVGSRENPAGTTGPAVGAGSGVDRRPETR